MLTIKNYLDRALVPDRIVVESNDGKNVLFDGTYLQMVDSEYFNVELHTFHLEEEIDKRNSIEMKKYTLYCRIAEY